MASLNLDEIHEVLLNVLNKGSNKSSELVNTLVEAFYSKVEELKKEKQQQKESKTKSKKEWAIIKNVSEDSFYIAQIGENENGVVPPDITKEIIDSVDEYNNKKNIKIYNVESAFLKISKVLKSRGVYLKTKEPINVYTIDDDSIQGC